VTQLSKDVLQEVQRNALGGGDALGRDRLLAVGGGQLHYRPDGVVSFGGDAHLRR